MKEVVAVIENVGFGCRDIGRPILFFSVDTMIGGGSLQCFSAKEALEMIEESGVYDVKDLNGRHCIVETDGSTMKFKKLLEK